MSEPDSDDPNERRSSVRDRLRRHREGEAAEDDSDNGITGESGQPRRRSATRDRLSQFRKSSSSGGRNNKLIIIAVVVGFILLAGYLFLKSRADRGPFDVNKATAAQLETLPGVGPETAKDIIGGRPYANPDDLLRVKGIGEKTLEKLKPGLTFPGE
ncbi:MAG: helix-hairpin-helix domain-containing protein [Verrucomicrobiales bacterium]|nr:helix-hairpin-helix domain-containing protein [Verrucomicrobiales bacterium]